MKATLVRNVFRPLFERVGTMFAAYLIARGVDSDLAAQLVNAMIAVVFVGVDLVTARVNVIRDETATLADREGD